MLRVKKAGGVLLEAGLIVCSVFLALAAENWREDRGERRLEKEYLQALREDLRADSAGFESLLLRSSEWERQAELVLEVVLSESPPPDPSGFLIAVERSSRWVPRPPVSRGAYDDLVGGGRLGLLQSGSLRRGLSEYHRTISDQEPVFELWRNRTWYGFGPIAQAAVPLEVQKWAGSTLEDAPDAFLDTPVPEALPEVAEKVAQSLRAHPDTEAALKSVLRSVAGLAGWASGMSAQAQEVLEAVERELDGL